jgi:hypothetical protein
LFILALPDQREWEVEWARTFLSHIRRLGYPAVELEQLLAEVDRLRGGGGDPLPAAALERARGRAAALAAREEERPPDGTGNVAVDVAMILLGEIDSFGEVAPGRL